MTGDAPHDAPRTGPVEVNGIRWTLAGQPSIPVDPTTLNLAQLLAEGKASVVKSGPHRTVYRVELPTLTVYWKHCKLHGIRAYARQCVRPPKAKMEFDRALALAKRGIATVEPLAWGVQSGVWIGESHLISRALAAVPLSSFLELEQHRLRPAEIPRFRREVAEGLARFLAKLHEGGVIHPDLHSGNLLVHRDASGQMQFHLIDVHDLRIGSALGRSASIANLVVLNRSFQLSSSRTDRARFWRTYLRGRPQSGFPFAEATEIEQRSAISNRLFREGRDKRCLGTNRYFRKVESHGVVGHAVREFDETILQSLLHNPDAPFANPHHRVLKDSRSTTVIEWVVPTPQGPRVMIYKRFRVKSIRDPWQNMVRPSPAMRSWMMGHALPLRGIPTARPWIVLHRRCYGFLWDGYILCEKVEGAHDLRTELDLRCLEPHWWQRKRILMDRLARLLRDLHERFLAHRDLKASNILVKEHEGEPMFVLIDLVGASVVSRITRRNQIKELARLHASFADDPRITRTDKRRFLETYLARGLRKTEDWRTWWNAINVATQRKRERNARHGRPLT